MISILFTFAKFIFLFIVDTMISNWNIDDQSDEAEEDAIKALYQSLN